VLVIEGSYPGPSASSSAGPLSHIQSRRSDKKAERATLLAQMQTLVAKPFQGRSRHSATRSGSCSCRRCTRSWTRTSWSGFTRPATDSLWLASAVGRAPSLGARN